MHVKAVQQNLGYMYLFFMQYNNSIFNFHPKMYLLYFVKYKNNFYIYNDKCRPYMAEILPMPRKTRSNLSII